jgi:hypothetical protein
MEDDLKKKKKKKEDDPKKNKKLKKNKSTKINLIGCDTIVNSPSISFAHKTDSNPKMLLKKLCKLTKFDNNIS